jgi:ribonuclease P protein component
MTSRYFAAFCLHATDDAVVMPARFGLTTPRALGKAVVRNRLKRRMREAIGSQIGEAPDRWSIVFNPRRNVAEAPFEDLCREVGRILERCKQS